jgi:hypothetical protein
LPDGPIGGSERHGGSSWQSFVRATGSIETDYLTGEIVLQGRLHAIATPVNELLQRLADQAAAERRAPGRRAKSWPCCTLHRGRARFACSAGAGDVVPAHRCTGR